MLPGSGYVRGIYQGFPDRWTGRYGLEVRCGRVSIRPNDSWYFKQSALIDRSRYSESETHSNCGWKGECRVSHCVVLPRISSSSRNLEAYIPRETSLILGQASYYNYKTDDGETIKDIAW